MKKTIPVMGGLLLSLLSLTMSAQQTWDAKKNPTVDSIASLYRDKIVKAPTPPGRADIFPVIGQYESATNPDAAHIVINVDEENKGIAWVEGLPQGKVKAMLRKSPATYKIPAQKTAEGNEVAEGTLIYDKTTNTLSICIGKPYNPEDPASAFVPATETTAPATVKGPKVKKPVTPKAWIYTGTKQVLETVKN
ncbi:MAG: hypothetical protein J0M10_16925 [Chitinophagales bacterium]|nr:hypothetical protein [Chitinophagales bacterium]